MNKLYCVPLGSSARQFFINEIEQQGWDKALLVLPSGVLYLHILLICYYIQHESLKT